MADISRNSFDESKNYDKVILQQGKPITDYDWNEAQDINRIRLQRVISELFGDGAISDGYKVFLDGSTLKVTAGTIYVKGYRSALSVNTAVSGVPTGNGTYKVYINLSEQEIDSVMDPGIKHTKLSMEPTRRIKILVNVEVGLTVPVDTSTNKYYLLADITVAGGVVTTVTDQRTVKEPQGGAGFIIKSGVTLGDAEEDVLNFVGKIKNTGSTFNGRVYIEDNAQITGDLHLGGNLIITGTVKPTGQPILVNEIYLFGIAGDLQYQSDSAAWEDVSQKLYNLFTTNTFPAPASGATRQYKLVLAYSDNIAGADNIFGQIRLVADATGTEIVSPWSLPIVTGLTDGSRRFIELPLFSANPAGHIRIQARITNAEGNLASTTKLLSIMSIKLMAYDIYS